jgi:thiamine pyrophosphate-dependent acetolactate synthase large subunit-like protein
LPFELVQEADALLVVGMRAGTSASEILDQHAPADYAYLTPDGEEDVSEQAVISASVDAKVLLSALVDRLKEEGRTPSTWAAQQIRESKDSLRSGLDQAVEEWRGRKPLHFGLALKELVSLLEENAVVVTDIGNHGVWASWFFDLYGQQTFVGPGKWGAMGFALPGSIAAKLVYPDRQVVGITGDGAFLMSCGDLGTTLEAGTNVVIVVLNDRRYGMIHALQSQEFGRTMGTELRGPDLVKFAESFGAVGIRVEDASELNPALSKALESDGPVIVDVICGYDFPHPAPAEWLKGPPV